MLIEPCDGSTVLGAERLRDPDHGARIEPCRVGHDLSKVRVIRRAKLVLNEDKTIVVVLADQISAIVSNSHLSACWHQLDFKGVGEKRDAFLCGEPRRKVVRFVPPNRPHINALKSTKPGSSHRRSVSTASESAATQGGHVVERKHPRRSSAHAEGFRGSVARAISAAGSTSPAPITFAD